MVADIGPLPEGGLTLEVQPNDEQRAERSIKPPAHSACKRYVRVTQRALAELRAASEIDLAQQRLNQRFHQIKVEDMHKEGVFIISTIRLSAPSGFERVWTVVDGDSDVEAVITQENVENMSSAAAILLIADSQSEEQVARVCMIAKTFNDSAGDNSPPLLWMPHSSSPDVCGDCDDDFSVHELIMNSGVDDILTGEPDGTELALNIRCRISKQRLLSEKVNRAISKRRQLNQEAKSRFEFLQDSINAILWDYLRLRLHTGIPTVDLEAAPGIPGRIQGYQLGQPLGSGNLGKVFALNIEGRGSSGQVVKCIPKQHVSHITGLRSIKNQIQILKMLTELHPHDNIVRFGAVYHTETHILVRMEDGGHMNLFKRLKLREKEPEDWLLSLAKVLMLFSQAIEAVAHMHSCQIVHRDIKPENICIRETSEDIKLKLTDFDVAIIAHPGFRSSHLVGTFPFIAPEVVAENAYDPYPSDIWSLGILFAEIGCGAHILDHMLQIEREYQRQRQEYQRQKEPDIVVAKSLIKQVAQHFSEEDAAGKVLDTYLRPELLPIAESLRFMLNQMICTQVQLRLSAPQVLQLSHALDPLAQQQEHADIPGAELDSATRGSEILAELAE